MRKSKPRKPELRLAVVASRQTTVDPRRTRVDVKLVRRSKETLQKLRITIIALLHVYFRNILALNAAILANYLSIEIYVYTSEIFWH